MLLTINGYEYEKDNVVTIQEGTVLQDTFNKISKDKIIILNGSIKENLNLTTDVLVYGDIGNDLEITSTGLVMIFGTVGNNVIIKAKKGIDVVNVGSNCALVSDGDVDLQDSGSNLLIKGHNIDGDEIGDHARIYYTGSSPDITKIGNNPHIAPA